jgi:hypothetical protein
VKVTTDHVYGIVIALIYLALLVGVYYASGKTLFVFFAGIMLAVEYYVLVRYDRA